MMHDAPGKLEGILAGRRGQGIAHPARNLVEDPVTPGLSVICLVSPLARPALWGGKAAVVAALAAPHALEKLVVTDFAPAAGAMLPEWAAHVDAMARIQEMGLRLRENAQVVLRETESVQ
jgi:hypothetical protein